MTTPYHAKYFAHELTRQAQPGGVDRLSMALFDACVDLNPHQIEAAMFALRSPPSKGVVLADEVGLGKTIEAGLVLCQRWAERKRKLLVICPASLRKQWSLELAEKFNLPSVILDSKTYRQAVREGNGTPFASDKVVITSFHYASRFRGDIRAVPFDVVVIDEAHKLRNAYRPSNKMGQNIKWAVEERKKCLLTATPLQNTLLELYGLSTILDDLIFGDVNSFRTQYTNAGADLNALRGRLQSFCKRTLRRQVVEYIQYTERIPFTVRFRPTDDEQKLYEAVSDFLNRDETYSVPHRQRHLTALILRKLLASSSHAIANTLETMKTRLEEMRDAPKRSEDDEEFPARPRFARPQPKFAQEAKLSTVSSMEELIENEELEDDYLDEILEGTTDEEEQAETEIDRQKLGGEIDELARYAQWARSIGIDTKSRSLLKALELGFAEMDKMGANRKALIFTESRRTQEYLKNFLESNGYGGQLVLFNGTNSDPDSRRIISKWVEDNAATGRVTGSRPIDSRTALIEHFQNYASVMIATEAAAEGVNMQFCSLVVNYDLPWNPQRIEQRIGRCHRYGQKHDVVVINFLNERNEADRRVHELLSEKFNLFNGVFGASDEVLGQIESGADFEKRILAIYQQCRTPEEIDAAFQQLQTEMDETIRSKMDETRQMLMEHFDEDVHARLKMRLDDARANLDRIGRHFWMLTKVGLNGHAEFCDESLTFQLHNPPVGQCRAGTYHLISKEHHNVLGDFLYRLSHPLGEWSIDRGKESDTPVAKVTFDVTNYPAKVSVVEALLGRSGWLTLQYLTIDSFDPRGPWLSCSLLGKATASQRPNLHYDFENPETGEVFSPKEETGWICSPATMQKNIEEKKILWPKKEGGRPRVKVFRSELKSDVMGFPSIISDVFTSDGTTELRQMFSQQVYVFPKPSAFVRRFVDQGTSNDSFVIDFFAGSGPTAHAVLDQNREDGGNRKYVLVEVADYFDVALKPRVQKAIYSQTWEDAKPKCRSGTSHAFKYIRLESYEDALNNLEMKRTDQQASLLDEDDDLREQYALSYMLDVESRGSQSLLNVESFRNPDQYKIRVERNGETQLVNVDLVETFNWLLGLTVKHIDVIRGVRVVEGTNLDGDRTLVLWRNLDETSNDALDEWFKKQDYNTKDQEYDLIYVNGDNNLENLRRGDQTWKVRLIEEEFGRLMFDVQDV